MQPGNENSRILVRLESGYRVLVGTIAALVMATAALVLVGWFFGIEALVRVHQDYNPMRFNTALCLLASGGGVWLIASRDFKWRAMLARLLGFFVCATALATLAEHAFERDFHIDQLLWRDVFSPSQPGRMVPLTALFFVWAGTFVVLSASKRTSVILAGQVVAILANLAAQGAILDLIFRSNKVEGAASLTGAAMFVLSVGMLLVPNRNGILAPLANTSAGGRIIRSLLPIATLVPLAAGWVYLEATQGGLLTWGSGFVIVVLLYSASLLLVTIWTANSIDRVDLRLAAIIDWSDDAIFSETIDGRIISWNPGAERLFGYAGSEAVGLSMFMLVPPERRRELKDLLGRVWQGESINQFETVRVRKDGTEIDVSVTISPVRNARGEITAVSVVAQNITARKDAEKRSKRASRYTRSLLEASLDPLVTISREGRITDVNDATEHAVGMCREDLIGTDFSEYFTEPEKAREGYRTAFAEGMVRGYPLAIRSKSGAVAEVLYNASVFRNEAGEVEGVFAAARDVTERNRIEAARAKANEELRELNLELESRVEARTQELRESEEKVRKKLESILSPEGDLEHFALSDVIDPEAFQPLAEKLHKMTSMPLAIIDLEGNILLGAGWQSVCTSFHRADPEACKNCRESDQHLTRGVAAGEFKLYKCKNHMWDVVTPIVLGDRHIGNFFSGQFFFEDEKTDVAIFKEQAKKFGFDEKAYLEAIARVPRLRREQVMTGMAFYAKLTDMLVNQGYSAIKLSRAMAETTAVNGQLAASMKELESFAYSVSHDLRAPLRHIDGFLTLLSNNKYAALDDTAKHYIDRTLEGSRRMGQLIDDLLHFSRIGRAELHKMPVDLNAVIRDVVKELEPEVGKRQIDWQFTELPRVAADRAMLLQVIENLVGNALKFTRGRDVAKIEIGFRPGLNGEVVFFVADNGAGFDMRYYNKLFQVFQRLHGEQEFEGTGIGLAIARSVIERHGGRIWAESVVGEGATFYFSLPAECREGGMNELAEAYLAG
jgi:PAS domain S-box-containing protein